MEELVRKLKELKTSNYIGILVSTIIFELVALIFVGILLEKKAEAVNEKWYHDLDMSYGNAFISSLEEGLKPENFAQLKDDKSYIAVIDKSGEVLFNVDSGRNGVSAGNFFDFIKNKASLNSMTKEEAINKIISQDRGRIDYSFSSKNRILLHTPCDESGEYFVIRIMLKKNFYDMKDEFSSFSILYIFVAVFVLAVQFVFVRNLVIRTIDAENKIDRNNIISSDNDIVSFTFHRSIGCFEMTGAVEKSFGSEIAARTHVDWGSLSEHLHSEDQSILRDISKAVEKGENKISTEFRIKDIEDAEVYHWCRLKGKVIRDENGDSVRFVGTLQNSDDQISHENMLKNRAEHDLLTGLLNKMTTEECINKALKEDSRNAFAFFIMDLDNFKAVNDNLGHATGDLVLTDVASKLKLVFNSNDIIGRLGGDEFAVLLVIPSQMAGGADNLIRHKAKLLNETMREEYGSEKMQISVSCSIGIAVASGDGSDFQSLYQCADKALYYSKNNGKNRFTFYDELKESQ